MQDIDKKIKVAITHGDINGIGYELMIRVLEDPEIHDLLTPVIYGSEKAWKFYANLFGMKYPCNFIRDAHDVRHGMVNIVSAVQTEARVEMGKQTQETEIYSRQAIEKALDDYAQGLFDVLVMAPANSDDVDAVAQILRQDEKAEDGNTGKTTASLPINVISNNNVCFASVAGDVNYTDASQRLTIDAVVERATTLKNTLMRDMRENNPRIAVLSLNETIKAEEGTAEIDVIAPAITQLVNSGVQVFGPYTKQDLMEDFAYTHFDGILGMYQHQVMDISNNLFDDNGYVLHSGLDLVLTSSMQGPSYEICGKGIAELTSFRNSIFAAIDVYRSRYHYDLPLVNPLQKIYHERREDGEKVRFAVKKKDFEAKPAASEEK